jgi:hypothetical protein
MVTRPEDIYPALSEAYNAGDFEALVSIELDLRQPGELAVVIEQTQGCSSGGPALACGTIVVNKASSATRQYTVQRLRRPRLRGLKGLLPPSHA